MKLITIILLSMVFIGCKSRQLIKFNQKVKITSGFYEGCYGTVQNYSIYMYGISTYIYYIAVDNSCPIDFVSAKSDELEVVQECFK